VPPLTYFAEPVQPMAREQKAQYDKALSRYKSGKSRDPFLLLGEPEPNDSNRLNVKFDPKMGVTSRQHLNASQSIVNTGPKFVSPKGSKMSMHDYRTISQCRSFPLAEQASSIEQKASKIDQDISALELLNESSRMISGLGNRLPAI
jgi:hypothetical protein